MFWTLLNEELNLTLLTTHVVYISTFYDLAFFKSKSSHRRCSVKKNEFLKTLQNSQESICARVFLSKVAGLRPATLLKKRLWDRCFPLNFAK